jgi:F-type H+-transporting ATPase subunit delta
MIDYKVSYRYASSLLKMAVDKNILEKTAVDAELIRNVLKENAALRRMLENPVIRPHIKTSILEEIFKSKIDKETMHFLKFVIQKDREDLLYNICQKFIELYNEKLGIVNVDVRTAFEFDEEQKEMLKNKLEKYLNKKTHIGFTLDKKIIGGFFAKIGDTVYDASVQHQLELLKKQFVLGGQSLN